MGDIHVWLWPPSRSVAAKLSVYDTRWTSEVVFSSSGSLFQNPCSWTTFSLSPFNKHAHIGQTCLNHIFVTTTLDVINHMHHILMFETTCFAHFCLFVSRKRCFPKTDLNPSKVDEIHSSCRKMCSHFLRKRWSRCVLNGKNGSLNYRLFFQSQSLNCKIMRTSVGSLKSMVHKRIKSSTDELIWLEHLRWNTNIIGFRGDLN